MNTWISFEGTIPLWLALHHSRVLLEHFINAIFLTITNTHQVLLVSLASQSSHNAWTKKQSLAIYCDNVIVGVLAFLRIHLSHEEDNFASKCFYYSLILTSYGVILLILQTVSKKNFGIKRNA